MLITFKWPNQYSWIIAKNLFEIEPPFKQKPNKNQLSRLRATDTLVKLIAPLFCVEGKETVDANLGFTFVVEVNVFFCIKSRSNYYIIIAFQTYFKLIGETSKSFTRLNQISLRVPCSEWLIISQQAFNLVMLIHSTAWWLKSLLNEVLKYRSVKK